MNFIEVGLGARTCIKERDCGIAMLANRDNARGLHGEAGAHRLIQRGELGNHLLYRAFLWRPNGSRLSCGASAGGRKRPALRYELVGAQTSASSEGRPRQLQALVRHSAVRSHPFLPCDTSECARRAIAPTVPAPR